MRMYPNQIYPVTFQTMGANNTKTEEISKLKQEFNISVEDLKGLQNQFYSLDLNRNQHLDQNEFHKALGKFFILFRGDSDVF